MGGVGFAVSPTAVGRGVGLGTGAAVVGRGVGAVGCIVGFVVGFAVASSSAHESEQKAEYALSHITPWHQESETWEIERQPHGACRAATRGEKKNYRQVK